ncbi:MAG: hypothetical protein ACFB00_00565 [Parvularculaceae bacterium]
MEDLNYIVGLGFSGTDLPRALIISFLLAVLFAPKRSVWQLGAFALIVDRLLWPLVQQSISGAGTETVFASGGALVETFMDDLGVYAVRYVGLTMMIGMFAQMRRWVDQMTPAENPA